MISPSVFSLNKFVSTDDDKLFTRTSLGFGILTLRDWTKDSGELMADLMDGSF